MPIAFEDERVTYTDLRYFMIANPQVRTMIRDGPRTPGARRGGEE